METLFIVMHVIFCIFLILVILLQTGKGAGMGAAFGGGSSTVFGPRGAGSFIGKATGVVAALFMITSLTLAYLSSSGTTGLADKAGALADKRSGDVEEVDLAAAAAEATKTQEAPETAEPEPPVGTGDAGQDGTASSTGASDGGAAPPSPAAAEPGASEGQAASGDAGAGTASP